MKSNLRYRPRLDRLEDRTCPALAFHYASGLLIVSGVPTSGTVSIQETGPGTFSVQDGGGTASVFGRVSNLSVNLGNAASTVDINLNGNTLAGSLTTTFAGGANTLSIENGTVGFLTIRGGSGGTTLTLGDGSSLLKVMRDSVISLAGNSGDSVTAANNADFVGNLTVANAASVNLASGSTVGRSAVFSAARIGTDVVDDATVGSDVVFVSSVPLANGQNTLEVDGTVGLDVVVSAGALNLVGTEVDINANVARNVTIATGGLADTVNVATGVNVGGVLTVALARGSDSLNVSDGSTLGGALLLLGNGPRQVMFGATVGKNTNVLVFEMLGGTGAETVTFTAGATFRGVGIVSLSPFSNNTVSFASAQTFNTFAFTIDGGIFGTNTLNLSGSTGHKLFFRHFTTVNA
jgi:hypothetical protein